MDPKRPSERLFEYLGNTPNNKQFQKGVPFRHISLFFFTQTNPIARSRGQLDSRTLSCFAIAYGTDENHMVSSLFLTKEHTPHDLHL